MIEQLLQQQNQLLGELIATLRELKPQAPPALNMVFPIEEYHGFDFAQIGARVIAHDEDGPTIIERDGRQYRRRSPQNKFGGDVWYSKSLGKEENGKPLYEILVSFKEIDDSKVDPLSPNAQRAIARKATQSGGATGPVAATPVQPVSETRAAVALQQPSPKEQLMRAVDVEFKRLNWLKDSRHRQFLLEELSVDDAEWRGENWYFDLLRASSESQLQALVAKLKGYGKPEMERMLNSTTFWQAARQLQVGEYRAFSDDAIKTYIQRFSSEGKTDWNGALEALKLEALKREASQMAQAV